jgi:hypothetical protein
MPKTNAAGESTFYDARGTDETAENAHGEVSLLDPTAHPSEDENKIVDNEGLTIEDDGDFKTREDLEREANDTDRRGDESDEQRDERLASARRELQEHDTADPKSLTGPQTAAGKREAAKRAADVKSDNKDAK